MTDEKMDARLRAAGDRWRADATNATAEDDGSSGTELLVHLPAPRTRHRWITAASAAVVTAALVIGGLYFLRTDDSVDRNQPMADSSQKLVGTTWTMPVSGQTLVFTTSRVTSTYLCSKRTSTVRIDAGRLTFGDTIGTPEECSYPDPGAAKQAALQRFSDVATGAVRWSIDRNTLTLTKAGVGSISLTRPVELSDLAGTTWGVAGTRISLVFNGNTMRTSNGCVSGEYTVRVDRGRVTQERELGGKACSPPPSPAGASATTADRFAAIVAGTFDLALDGDRLTISRTGVKAVALTSNGAGPALIGPTWRLERIVNDQGVRQAVDPTTTLQIGSDHRLRTSDQCGNDYNVALTFGSGTFTPPANLMHTMVGCSTEALAAGGKVIAEVLSNTVSWSINGNELTLVGAITKAELIYTVDAPKTTTAASLVGTSWNLTTIETQAGTGANAPVVSAAAIGDTRLSFGENTLTLGDTCYEITGTIEYDTGTFTLSGVQAGERPNVRCDSNGERVDQEANLRKLLAAGVVAWTIDDDGALSLSRYNLTAGFEPAKQSTANILEGTSWRLSDTATESTSGNSSSGSGSSAVSRSNLTFSEAGRFTLTHKCYSNAGDYSVSGQTITFSNVHGAGAIPCPSNAESFMGQQENNLVDTLLANGSTTFTLRDGVLTIKKADHTADFAKK